VSDTATALLVIALVHVTVGCSSDVGSCVVSHFVSSICHTGSISLCVDLFMFMCLYFMVLILHY